MTNAKLLNFISFLAFGLAMLATVGALVPIELLQHYRMWFVLAAIACIAISWLTKPHEPGNGNDQEDPEVETQDRAPEKTLASVGH